MDSRTITTDAGPTLDRATLLGLLKRIMAGDSSALPMLRALSGSSAPKAGSDGGPVRLPPLSAYGKGNPTLEIPGRGSSTLEVPSYPTITPRLLELISKRESGGRDTAVGKKGERGRFQIMPATARAYGITDPAALQNPAVSRWVAQRLLDDLSKHYKGDLRKTLEAYNAGEGRVDRGQVPKQSVQYADAILQQEGRQPALQTKGLLTPQKTIPTPSKGVSAPSKGILSGLSLEGTAQAADLPPLPPGFKLDTPSAAAPKGLPPLPPGFKLDTPSATATPTDPRADIKNVLEGSTGATTPLVPLPSNIIRRDISSGLDWLPAIGQGAALLTAPELEGPILSAEGLEALMARAGASGLGTMVGEEGRLGGRRVAGLPSDRSQKDVLTSGQESAALQPAGDIALRGLTNLAVPGRRIARKAATQFRRGSEALEDLWERTGKMLGMTKDAAEHAADNPSASRAFRGTLWKIRSQAKDVFHQRYENLLRFFYRWRTPDYIYAAYLAGLRHLTTLQQLDLPLAEDVPQRVVRALESNAPMTVQREQQLVSDLKQIRYAIKPDEHNDVKRALDQMIKAGESDIDYVLDRYGPPGTVAQYRKINSDYGDMLKQISERDYRAISKEPNLPSAAYKFWNNQTTSQISEAFKYADSLPPSERDAAYAALRRSFAASIWNAADDGRGSIPKLGAMKVQILKTPDRVLEDLYTDQKVIPTAQGRAIMRTKLPILRGKAEWLAALDKVESKFGHILTARTEREAIERAVDERIARDSGLLNYLKHHAIFASMMILASGGAFLSGHHVLSLGAGAAAVLTMAAMRSEAGMAAYRALAYSKTADEAGRYIAAILNAAFAEEIKQGNVIAKKSAGR